jgi:hypothetical protein
MVTPRTGRDRGRPSTLATWARDPDRHVMALTGVFGRLYPRLEFELAVPAALATLRGAPVELPAKPLKHARRLKLTRRQIRAIERGYHLEACDLPEKDGRDGKVGKRVVERLRKKFARVAGNPDVTRWRGLMGMAWGAWLAASRGAWPIDGPGTEEVVLAFADQAGEGKFARNVMLPRLPAATRAQPNLTLESRLPD